ncbi:hypothetical protein [Rhodococcus koreensis]|uniref:hypothetical protein n=1 Tax=Rhodococcus koreensis TaxID=99653 RepID=UPI001FC994FC|nr:hypothetical protein [Rhodococcus koreensis]
MPKLLLSFNTQLGSHSLGGPFAVRGLNGRNSDVKAKPLCARPGVSNIREVDEFLMEVVP